MKNYLQLILVLFIVIQVQAQEKIVTGNVSDSTGPLPGTIVIVKGTINGTQTDFDGNYSIKATVGDTIGLFFFRNEYNGENYWYSKHYKCCNVRKC